jgi:putative acetyltransferase
MPSTPSIVIHRELPEDVEAVRTVVAAAFADQTPPDAAAGAVPVEVTLVDALRATDEWLPPLSMVAEVDGDVVGYVVCSRAWVETHPVLGLGPLAVSPTSQGSGVGSALMHAILGAADALDEPLVALLGHTDYYPRFGFRAASTLGIVAPVAAWGDHFQARPMTAYDPAIRGAFRYAQPFNDL